MNSSIKILKICTSIITINISMSCTSEMQELETSARTEFIVGNPAVFGATNGQDIINIMRYDIEGLRPLIAPIKINSPVFKELMHSTLSGFPNFKRVLDSEITAEEARNIQLLHNPT